MSKDNRQDGGIFITDQDYQRLSGLVSRIDSEITEFLEGELGRANILPQDRIPADVVTMNSKVRFQNLENGEFSELTLVYPQDADIAQGRVSVLAPIGAALIGLRAGQSIESPLPNARELRLRVTAIVYQPEASGDWHL